MTIDKIAVGSSIVLSVSVKDSKIEFNSMVVAVWKQQYGVLHGIVIPVIKQDDKIITFESVKVKATITNSEDHRIYEFNLLKIIRNTYNGEQCYIAFSPDNIKPINYRDAVRVPYCEECILQVGPHKKAIDCYVRDISQTGISFSFPAHTISYKVGDEVSAQFDVDGNPIKISARVVRGLTETDCGRDIIGCSLNRDYPIINKLVSKLQTRNKT